MPATIALTKKTFSANDPHTIQRRIALQSIWPAGILHDESMGELVIEMSPSFDSPLLSFGEPSPNNPGVFVEKAKFSSRGPDVTPFRGCRLNVDPGATSSLDAHEKRECWMVASGGGLLTYDGREYRVGTGDFLYFEPKLSHKVHNDGAIELVIFAIWWIPQI